MKTETRKERQAAHKAKMQAWKAEVESTVRPGSKQEIVDAIRQTNLKYAWNTEPKPHTTKESVKATTNDGCMQVSIDIPAGTQGWVFINRDYVYDQYVRIDDMELPAKDAKVVKVTSYYTFGCLVKANGQWQMAHSFATVERTN